MPARRCRSFKGLHRVWEWRRAVRQPPDQPQGGRQEDRDADRFVKLIYLKQPHRRQLNMDHYEAHDRKDRDAYRHHPMKENGNQRIPP